MGPNAAGYVTPARPMGSPLRAATLVWGLPAKNRRLAVSTYYARRLISASVLMCVSLLTVSIALAQPGTGRPGGKPPAAPKGGGTTPKAPSLAGGPDEKIKFEVDPNSKRNEVNFTSKAPGETIKGHSSACTGSLTINPAKLDSAEGSFTVAWQSIDTGNKMRNQHMMGSPWVDATAHPDIVFTVTGIEQVKSAGQAGKAVKGTLVGKFAMNGVEKEVKIPATIAIVNATGADKEKIGLGIKASFKVALADYKIEGKGLGDKVARSQDITVSLNLRRAGDKSSDDASDGETKPKPKKPETKKPAKKTPVN